MLTAKTLKLIKYSVHRLKLACVLNVTRSTAAADGNVINK